MGTLKVELLSLAPKFGGPHSTLRPPHRFWLTLRPALLDLNRLNKAKLTPLQPAETEFAAVYTQPRINTPGDIKGTIGAILAIVK
jgi:hypothetical protein